MRNGASPADPSHADAAERARGDKAVGRFLVLVAGCVLSCACATTRYTQSRIEAVPSEVKGRSGSRASVEVEGLKVRLESLDRTPVGEAIPRLALRAVFEPRELGYSFDPGQVVLRDGKGGEWRASGSGYRLVHPGSEVDLVFDVAVSPETEAELVLGGLACGPKRLAPVTLRLARRSGRSYDRLYWLEAIGTVLMAPLAVAGGGM
jgi:hypothetical protein